MPWHHSLIDEGKNMKMPSFFETDLQETIRREYLADSKFKENLMLQNMRRGKLLAMVVIGIELIYLCVDIAASILEINNAFAYYAYMTLYIIMIVWNLAYLFLLRLYDRKKFPVRIMNACTVLYLTLMMAWGSAVSLLDQRMYGQLMSFMVNIMVCSIIYLLDAKKMGIPYLTSTLLLVIGLPFFQSSGDMLVGHYINLVVFLIIAWAASRIVYRNYCDNYVIQELMKQSQSQLKTEIEKNRMINRKLAMANAQLKKLALLDELTGLPNRRSFRKYIDRMFERCDSGVEVPVIMIDIDNFKQYNDAYGHETGDLALTAVAEQINAMVERPDQIAVRWGGEEFIYAAFHQSRESVLSMANDLRLKISNLKIPTEYPTISPSITISLGLCYGTISSAKRINRVISMADQALYQAKSEGRNCIAVLEYRDDPDGDSE